jgi:hypothetical protein
MKRSFRAFLVAVLLAAPLLSSCSDVNPMEPVPSTTIERQDGLLGGLLGGVLDLVGGVVNLLGSVLTGPDANGSAKSAWIGSNGGTIQTAAYTLTVPRGAVSKNTRFEVKPTNTGAYMLELNAYEKTLLGETNVGQRGFKKPVKLTISYKNAEGVTDPKKLAIVYIISPTKGEVQKTAVDSKDRDVTAELKHFSKYAMIQN